MFKEGHNFYFYFLKLWACGLILLFLDCGFSMVVVGFFLKE
jgi:hypothetical protein